MTNKEIKDQETVEMVDGYYTDFKKGRKELMEDYRRYEKMYDGDQWDKAHRKDRSDVVLNYCHSTIQQISALLSEGRPKPFVLPQEQNDEEFAGKLGKTLDFIWQNFYLSNLLRQTSIPMGIYGTAFWEIIWNRHAAQGKGDFEFNLIFPQQVFPEPSSASFRDCKRLIIATPMDVKQIKYMYGQEVNPDIEVSDFGKKRSYNNAYDGNTYYLTHPTAGTTNYFKDTSGVGSKYQNDCNYKAIVKKLWLFDEPDKYPKGRLIITAGGKLVRDGENPFNNGKSNLVPFYDQLDPGCFWGEGEIKQVEKLQKTINKLVAQIVDNANLMGNSQVITDDPAFDVEKYVNTAGKIYKITQGSRFERIPPPPLPFGNFKLIDMLRYAFDSVTGIHDVTQGRKPEGIQSGRAIGFLQEAAQTLVNLKLKNIEDSLSYFGKLMCSNIVQFYSAPRTLRIIGKEGGVEYMRFNQPFGDVNTLEKLDQDDVEYDVRMEIGSELPQNKVARFNQYLQLFQLGVIDKIALLEASGIPNKEQEIAKLKQAIEQQAQMAEQQAAMQQAQEGMQGGGAPPALPANELPPVGAQEAMPQEMGAMLQGLLGGGTNV